MTSPAKLVLAAAAALWVAMTGWALYQAPPPDDTVSGARWQFHKGRHGKSFPAFLRLSRKEPGNAAVRFWLARHYAQGAGTTRDLDKAIELYAQLSAAGMTAAPMWLAKALEKRGRSNDLSQAMGLHKLSLARRPHASSALRLAAAYRNGIGVRRDKVLALRYLARAYLLQPGGIDPQPYHCAELISALRHERAVAKERADRKKIQSLDGETFKLQDCLVAADATDWKRRVFLRIASYAGFSTAPGASLLPPAPQQKSVALAVGSGADVVPPGFAMTFSMASDADSQSYQHLVANQTIIQQNF